MQPVFSAPTGINSPARSFSPGSPARRSATAEAQKTAVSLFGEEKVIRQRQPALGGDDFAEYILRAPGAYAYVGSGNPEKPNTELAHHNSRFDIDEDCLKAAVALYSCYTIEYLNGEV